MAESNLEIVTRRTVNAPPSLVFEAFADAARLARWWGPKGFRNTFHAFDFRPGGAWRYTMHGPDGTDYPNESVFRELAAGSRVMLDHLGAHPFRAEFDLADAGGGRTAITFTMRHETKADHDAAMAFAPECNEQNFDRLEAALREMQEADRAIVIERLIRAPREKVFRAFSDPAQVGQWWGPDGFTTTTERMDFRVGGEWKYTMHGPDGRDYPNLIRYTAIEVPRLIAYDHGDGETMPMFRTSAEFEEEGGFTRVRLRSVFPTAEALQVVVREYKADIGAQQHIANLAAFVE